MTVFASLLITDFTHSRRRRTSDGQGGWAIDYVPQGTVRGRVRPATSTEREVAATEERQVTHVFYCKADEDVRRGDRLTATSPTGYALTLEVDGLREPSLAGEHYEFDCNERQVGESTPEDGS